MSEVGWFACYDDEQGSEAFPWMPALQCDGSICLTFDVWFATEEACEDFIRTEVLGKPLIGSTAVIQSETQ